MPEGQHDERFKRDLENSSELDYVRKMKYFYESQFDELSRKIGQETEFGVLITESSLTMIEGRLSEFEEKERELIKRYRRFAKELVF